MMHKLSFIELANEGERLCKSGDCSQGIKYFEAALNVYEQQRTAAAVASTTSTTSNQQPTTTITITTNHQTGEMIHDGCNQPEMATNQQQQQQQQQMLQTVSIIYNQLGNAYFNLQDYKNALEFHKKDLELSEQFGDESGKAKACGNVGNTLQLLGDYDEAIYYLLRNLEISKKLNDVSGEARALYNLANIYQAKGKFMGRVTYPADQSQQEPNTGEFAQEIREVLLKAVHYYNETLKLVANKERSAEGRTYGNLGNTYYLLGDFDAAIQCHQERLKIAREFGDKAAERRAYSNLGNAHIFQGRFLEAADYYLKAMNVARSLGDKAIEAQSYYSLGNAYTLLQDYALSIDFHHRHLLIAQTLDDKIGECRAYWSLGNSYAAMGDLENAIIYANKHLNLAQLIGDSTSELTAKKNLYDFQNLLTSSGFRDSESGLFTPICSKYGRKYLEKTGTGTIHKSASIDSFYTNVIFDRVNGPGGSGGCGGMYPPGGGGCPGSGGSGGPVPLRSLNNKPTSQGDLSLKIQAAAMSSGCSAKHHSLTDIENKSSGSLDGRMVAPTNGAHMGVSSLSSTTVRQATTTASTLNDPDLSFLEQITRMQSKRLDDQRCSLKPTSSSSLQSAKSGKQSGGKSGGGGATIPNEDFLDLIMKSQRTRLEDQRSSFSSRRRAGGEATAQTNGIMSSSNTNMSMTASSSATEIGRTNGAAANNTNTNSKTYTKQSKSHKNLPTGQAATSTTGTASAAAAAATNDDLFQMIERVQSRRFDEQRAPIKSSSLFRFGRRS